MEREHIILNEVLIRSPALPFAYLKNLIESNVDFNQIVNLVSDPFIREALYISSPSLVDQIDRASTNAIKPEKQKRLYHSLLKYLSRMSIRPTAFGLFSGVFVAKFADRTKIEVDSRNFERRSRLSFDVLISAHKALSTNKNVKPKLSYSINSSLYAIGEDYRFIKTTFLDSQKKYVLEQIKFTENLFETLNFFKEGRLILSYTDFMVQNGYERKDAEEYANQLIEAQILVPLTQPYLVGKPYLRFLNHFFSAILGDKCHELNNLKKISDLLNYFDENKINDTTYYEKLKTYLSETMEVSFSNPVQVDMFMNSGLSKINVKEKIIIARGLNVLLKIGYARNLEKIQEFKSHLLDRYSGNPTKLVHALDADCGLGYPVNRKYDNYWYLPEFESDSAKNIKHSYSISEFEKILRDKINSCGPSEHIEITDYDLEEFVVSKISMPPTFYALTERCIVKGNVNYFIPAIGSSTASALIGRFTGFNGNIDELVNKITKIEENYYSDSICAEIDHIPEEYTGNVLFRSNIRNAIIPFLSGGDFSQLEHIPISDIYISVEHGKLILRHGIKGKKIIPFLSNAHNYNRNPLPIYRILCDLQFANQNRELAFNWGDTGRNRIYLPRVFYKNVILSKARWIFSQRILKSFFKKSSDKNLKNMRIFRKRWNLSRYNNIVQNDNLLFIDLSSKLGIDLFFNEIKNMKACVLEEFICSDEFSIINQNGEGHLNQFLFSFKTNPAK